MSKHKRARRTMATCIAVCAVVAALVIGGSTAAGGTANAKTIGFVDFDFTSIVPHAFVVADQKAMGSSAGQSWCRTRKAIWDRPTPSARST